MTTGEIHTDEEQLVWSLLQAINDPEIPVVSVVDLGIVRKLEIIQPGEHVRVTITPTYSGCPAMDVITRDIKMILSSYGYRNVDIENSLSPAWTTDWISDEGKQKMLEYGIAPPRGKAYTRHELFAKADPVECPRCHSSDTRLLSEFGSTACKALYQCNTCQEPFDVFKCH